MSEFEAVRDYGRQHLGWDKDAPVTNHKDEALGIFEWCDRQNDPFAYAQVHATLYLAEQQRIANLLTLAQFTHSTSDGSVLRTDFDAAVSLRAEAAEALGVPR